MLRKNEDDTNRQDTQARPNGMIMTGAAVAIALTVVAGTLAILPGDQKGSPGSSGRSSTTLDPSEFDYSSSKEDSAAVLPQGLREYDFFEEADLNTLRSLGTSRGSQYWSVMKNSELCLVVTANEESAIAAGCATQAAFFKGGTGARLLTNDLAAEAYLLPDSVAGVTGKQLIIVDPFDPDRTMANVEIGQFELNKLPNVRPDEIPSAILK